MQQSTNYNMNKPDLTDQYDLAHWNQNTDIIDTELKKREDDDTALKNPVYTEAGADAPLVSGELFTTAFGKIAKAISSFITHKGTTTSVHGSTPDATASKIIERDANSRAKIADGLDIDDISTLKQIQNSALNKKFIGVKTIVNSNITLFGEQVVDGLSCVVGDIILVANQTTATENGIYIVQTGAWTRHSDYDTADKINNTLIGAYLGTNRGKVFKASTKTWVEGTTILSFSTGDYPIPDEAKKFWRDKIKACEEFKPPIGIPTIWLCAKPSWAIDFGNGSSTKYLWANYPELDNAQFKQIIHNLYLEGWMGNDYDNEGFYVPDLRGIVPICYGTNGVRTGETYYGGTSTGNFQSSQNKIHRHDKGTYKILGGVEMHRGAIYETYTSGALRGRDHVLADNSTVISLSGSGSKGYIDLDTSMNSGSGWTGYSGYDGSSGQASKPGTLAYMWIVRFE